MIADFSFLNLTHLWQACFISHWHSSVRCVRPARCPLCRAQVTLLVERFTDEERQSAAGRAHYLPDIERYNAMHTTFGFWRIRLLETMTLLSRLSRNPAHLLTLMRSTSLVGATIASITYVLTPFDFVPEALFGALGLLDDAIVVLFVVLLAASMYRRVIIEFGV